MNRWIHEERTWQNNIHYPKVTPKYLGISHCKREACRWVQGGTCRLHTLQAIQLLASLLSKVLAAEQKQRIAFWVHSHSNNYICQTFNQNRSNTTSRIPGLCILFLCCSVGGSILKAIIAMNEMRQLPWIILCRRHQVLCPSIRTAGNSKGIVSDGQPDLLETFKGPIQPFYVVRDSCLASYPPSSCPEEGHPMLTKEALPLLVRKPVQIITSQRIGERSQRFLVLPGIGETRSKVTSHHCFKGHVW